MKCHFSAFGWNSVSSVWLHCLSWTDQDPWLDLYASLTSKMNYYLINAIGLANTALQTMALWSSNEPDKRGSQKWGLAGSPRTSSGWACSLRKQKMVALGPLTSQPESENLTQGRVLFPVSTDTACWAFSSPKGNLRSWRAAGVAGQCDTG